jgi:hypothetical protein
VGDWAYSCLDVMDTAESGSEALPSENYFPFTSMLIAGEIMRQNRQVWVVRIIAKTGGCMECMRRR